MSSDDLVALRELSDAATPGPWIRPWGATHLHAMAGDFVPSPTDLDFMLAAVNYVRAALAAKPGEYARLSLVAALWQCGVTAGMDTDGDQGPGALIAGGGIERFAAAMVREVKALRDAYEECLAEPLALDAVTPETIEAQNAWEASQPHENGLLQPLAAKPEPGLDAERLLCGWCGDWNALDEIVGHLASEGRVIHLAEPGLDVERLGRALRGVSSCGVSCDHEGMEWTWTGPETFADALASEYLRLSDEGAEG